MSERCPTCGRPVPTIFEHVDVDCENWPSDWTMKDLKIPEGEDHETPSRNQDR